jgi:hypothetical protein
MRAFAAVLVAIAAAIDRMHTALYTDSGIGTLRMVTELASAEPNPSQTQRRRYLEPTRTTHCRSHRHEGESG